MGQLDQVQMKSSLTSPSRMTAHAVRVPRKRNENIPEVAVEAIGRVFDGEQDYAPNAMSNAKASTQSRLNRLAFALLLSPADRSRRFRRARGHGDGL